MTLRETAEKLAETLIRDLDPYLDEFISRGMSEKLSSASKCFLLDAIARRIRGAVLPLLESALIEEGRRVREEDAPLIDRLVDALQFSRSVIRCKEGWSHTCDQIIEGAIAAGFDFIRSRTTPKAPMGTPTVEAAREVFRAWMSLPTWLQEQVEEESRQEFEQTRVAAPEGGETGKHSPYCISHGGDYPCNCGLNPVGWRKA